MLNLSHTYTAFFAYPLWILVLYTCYLIFSQRFQGLSEALLCISTPLELCPVDSSHSISSHSSLIISAQ